MASDRYCVFLSYNSHDKPLVEDVARRLRDAGVRPFLDEWHLKAGKAWQEELEEALAASDSCAVFYGPAGISGWHNEELRIALERRAHHPDFPVIPVILPGASKPGDLPRFLRRLTWVDFRQDRPDPLARLIAAIPGRREGPENAEPRLKPWYVPHSRNPYFTGREDVLEALHRALGEVGAAALGQAVASPGQALSGLGGIGKTQTAVEYAYRHRDDYSVVLWTRAETEAALTAGFVDLARQLGLAERDARQQELAIEAVRRWLAREEGWLLVLDNADMPEIVKPFLPVSRKGRVLITSRARVFDVLGIRRPLRLETLPPADALRFLLERTERQGAAAGERAAAAEIAEELGCLPLALEQAGAFIEANEALFEDYLRSFRKRHLSLLEAAGPRAADYPSSVATTWAMNFEQVEAASEASAEVLRLCAFLAPDDIPQELLVLGAPELGSALSAALENAGEDPLMLDQLLEPLARYSLIDRDPEARRFDVHRMVQAVVRDALEVEDRRWWAERVVRALGRAFPDPEFPAWPLCERLVGHAAATLSLVERHDLELEEAAHLFNRAGSYTWYRGRYRAAEALYQRSLRIRERALGLDHPDVARSLNNLANLHRDQGDYAAAATLYERSLRILERALGPDHPHVASSLNNLANLHRDQRDHAAAEPLYERALRILEKALGPDHPHVASSLDNLATLHSDQGDLAKAEPLCERALRIREKALGPDHPHVATSLNNLAILHSDQGDLAKAAPLYERALRIQEKAFGPDHPDVATSLNNLAVLISNRGDRTVAEPLHERALRIREKALGPDHPHVATTLKDHALLLRKTGREEEALELEARAKAIREQRAEPGGD